MTNRPAADGTPDGAQQLYAQTRDLLEQLRRSQRPFLFPPVGATAREAVARLRFGVSDVRAMIPPDSGNRRTVGQVLQEVTAGLSADYPQYPYDKLECIVALAWAGADRLFEEVDRRVLKVTQDPTSTDFYTASIRMTMRIADVREGGRTLFYAVAMWLGIEVAMQTPLVMDIWARLATVPRVGEAESRAALLALAAHLEDFLASIVEITVEQELRDGVSAGREQHLRALRQRGGFARYRRYFTEVFGDDLLAPVAEVIARRNVFVHHAGAASEYYVSAFSSTIEVGDPLPLDCAYLEGAAALVESCGRAIVAELPAGTP
ncbi:hypothetical protein ABQF35_11105 [Mycobacterium syngnathidarum]